MRRTVRPGVYIGEPDELTSNDTMGRIGYLVSSQEWPAHLEWPSDVTSVVQGIKDAGNSMGPAGERARIIRDEKAARLKVLFHTYDIMHFLGLMAQHAIFGDENSRNWYDIYGINALVEYAVGVAIGETRGREEPLAPPDGCIQEAYDLISEIFAIEWFLVQYSQNRSLPPHVRRAQADLRMEALVDRWQGYLKHLITILRKTFSPIDQEVVSALGWSPLILPEIYAAIRDVLQRRMDTFHPMVHRRIRLAQAAGRERFDRVTIEIIREHYKFSRDLFIITPSDLVPGLTVPENTLRAALTDLSITPGCQPGFTLPTQENLVRTYGAVDLGDDRYFIWTPGALIQESHSWFYDLLQRRELESLRRRYLEARDSITEELTMSSLSHVFGTARTYRSVHYSADGHPDVDCLVIVPRDVLVVECKAHLMTAAGRRGAPGRLSKKFDELVSKPSMQAARFANHLRNGGTVYGLRRNPPLVIDDSSVLPRMVVTYERVDPLVAHSTTLAESTSNQPAWVLSLADLLTVVDLLPSPSTFWHYAVSRWLQSGEKALFVQSEVDMLGIFLENKDAFGKLIEVAQSEQGIAIGPAAHAINDYYTGLTRRGKSVRRPVVTVPSLITDALDAALQANEYRWKELIASTISEPNKTWTRLRSVLRKVNRVNKSRRFRLMTTDPDLELWIAHEPERTHLTVSTSN